MINDNDLRGYLNNRVPSRENCERVRAAGIVAEDIWVQEFADTLLDIRQAVRGGERHPAKNWDESMDKAQTAFKEGDVDAVVDIIIDHAAEAAVRKRWGGSNGI